MLLVVISLIILLSGCGPDVEVLEDDKYDISEYSVFYDGGDYIIYNQPVDFRLSSIPPKRIEELENVECLVHNKNDTEFIIYYEGDFYSLEDGVKLGLYNSYDLLDIDMPMACRLYTSEGEIAGVGMFNADYTNEVVGHIGIFAIIRDTTERCDLIPGEIIIEDFTFGYFTDGCDKSINSIGYKVWFSEYEYDLEYMVEYGFITVEEIHDIYMNDNNRLGVFFKN